MRNLSCLHKALRFSSGHFLLVVAYSDPVLCGADYEMAWRLLKQKWRKTQTLLFALITIIRVQQALKCWILHQEITVVVIVCFRLYYDIYDIYYDIYDIYYDDMI